MTDTRPIELVDEIDLSGIADPRIRRALMPWWRRRPQLLRAELDLIRGAGYLCWPRVSSEGRLHLAVTQPERQGMVGVLYPDSFPNGDVLYWKPPGSYALARSGAAERLATLRDLLELSSSGGVSIVEPLSVLMSAAWNRVSDGSGGEITYAAGAGPTLLAVSATGTRQADALERDSAHLRDTFATETTGWWVRGPLADRSEDPEQRLRMVEERVAAVHGLSVIQVRERQRSTRAPHAVVSTSGGDASWTFLLRDTGNQVVIGRAIPMEASPSARRPYHDVLRHMHVAIVGCGALGWRVATTLARAGVGAFTLIDAEEVQYDNLPRLNAGVDWVGSSKAEALRAEIRRNGEATTVSVFTDVFGEQVGPTPLLDARIDMVIDTTGSSASPQASNLLALALRRPAIFAWTSDGVKAARIFRVVPGRTPCYRCVQMARPTPIGPPVREDESQPSASEYVWEGANFNLDFVAAATARMAVLTIAAQAVDVANPDHVVLEIGDSVPKSRVLHFRRTKSCPLCAGLRVA